MASISNPTKAAAGRVRIALIGCNHRTAPVELRERITFTPEQALRAADELRLRGVLEEAVVLSTCNRSELYGVTPNPTADAQGAMENFLTDFHGVSSIDLSGRLYRQTNTEAVRHLFRVASGLDSMLLGEAEILGQVRDAYGRALEHGSTGPVLNRLFQGALEVGKRVRSETEVGARPMSVAWAGVKLAERVFGDLEGHEAIIVGAGAVAEQVVQHLRDRGIGRLLVVNRTRERADNLAERVGGETVDWTALESSLASPDIIVTSVGSSEPILTRALLERVHAARQGRALFVVDLGVPRNVEADAANLYNLYLYNIDDLDDIVEQNRKTREAEIPRAEALITEHIAKFETWCTSVEAISMTARLRERLLKERAALLQERAPELASLPEEDRERILRLTEELIERVVQTPSDRLRRTRELRRRLAGIEALRDLFGLDGEDS
ncbi:MAG: glutamyl-tRNA reductase [Candidatus Acidiferrales bacterium]